MVGEEAIPSEISASVPAASQHFTSALRHCFIDNTLGSYFHIHPSAILE